MKGKRQPERTSFGGKQTEIAFWLARGLASSGAKALVRAGILSLEDLQRQYREDLLRLRGLGKVQLSKCEKILGKRLPSRADYWTAKGFRRNEAMTLGRAGFRTIEEIEGKTREALLDIPFVGDATVRRLEELLGRPLPSFLRYWLDQGFAPGPAWKLAREGLSDIGELRNLPRSELRRIGLKDEEMAQCLKS